MKLYADYIHASMSMKDDPALQVALTALVLDYPIDVIIETGTYLGTGSTRILAEFFGRTGQLKRFVTMEANWLHWKLARANLKQFAVVDCLWGLSVSRDVAIEYVRTDPAIQNHQTYSDIFIDDVDDPVGFYTREVCGGAHQQSDGNAISGARDRIKRRLSSYFAASRELDVLAKVLWDGENLLPRMLDAHRNHRPLVVLDSAGGIGHLEFLITLERMKRASFALLLDDTHHLKHFRALKHVRSSAEFRVVATANDESWALCVHRE